MNKWKEQTGHELQEIYGQTELCVTIGTFPWMKICPGSMGKPSPHVRRGFGRRGRQHLPARRGGRNRGAHAAENPSRRACSWAITSDAEQHQERAGTTASTTRCDLAWRDEWGYYWYVGRADDVIKSSGYRIGPFEVESALMEHPAVVETAITAVPDPVRGQVVKATIVLATGYEPSDELKKELQDHVKRTTAPYKYPRIVEFVDELPKTISGKIRRVAIREAGEKKE